MAKYTKISTVFLSLEAGYSMAGTRANGYPGRCILMHGASYVESCMHAQAEPLQKSAMSITPIHAFTDGWQMSLNDFYVQLPLRRMI
jgi:hypothetical protein